jgi:CheY-like chemotaxis protein
VLTAAHGAEALVLMRKQVPDALVLDLQMPVLDGWAVVRICRQTPSWRSFR